MGKLIRPPSHLAAGGRELWRRMQAEYAITDAGGLALLRIACESSDLMSEALARARREGFVTKDKYGQRRSHPLLTTARDARSGMLQALRQLNLDLEPLRDRPGRPGGR